MTDLEPNKALITANTVADNLPRLTYQESQFVAAVGAGISLSISAARSGISITTAKNWLEKDYIQLHLNRLNQERAEVLSQTVKYTLEDAHLDIEMGKRMSANATEWYRGVELHMRLHGLGQQERKTEVHVNVANINNAQQMEALDDATLFELAGDDINRLQPEG